MKQLQRRFSLFLTLAGLPLWASAQQPPPAAETFGETVRVEVVNVEVFVTDKQGTPVTGLGKEDFELSVDGQAVPISNFYAAAGGRPTGGRPAGDRPTAVPAPDAGLAGAAPPEQRLHIAVVVDNDHIRAANRKRVFGELRVFLDTRLRDDDLVTVASLNPELVIHSDFLSDRAAVAAMLDELERVSDRPQVQETERRQILDRLSTTGREYNRQQYAETSGGFESPEILTRIRAWAESEYARSQNTLRTLGQMVGSLAGVTGRKALLYVSDGFANRPGEEMYVAWSDRFGGGTPAPQGLRNAGFDTDYFREIGRFDLVDQVKDLGRLASAARVTWYSLDAESDHAATLRSADLAGGVSNEALDVLEANVREPLDVAAELTGGRRIQASTRLDADLAAIATDFETYYSLGFTPAPESGPKDHRIRVKVRGKGLVVRHRESWQPRSNDDLAAERTTAALLYHAVANPLGVDLELGTPQRRDDGSFLLPVDVRIPIANLLLVPRGDVYATQLSLFVTTRDRSGQARRIQKLPFNAAIPAGQLEQARGQSARYTLPMIVRPGDQEIAVGVRDDLGSAESYVRVELTSLN